MSITHGRARVALFTRYVQSTPAFLFLCWRQRQQERERERLRRYRLSKAPCVDDSNNMTAVTVGGVNYPCSLSLCVCADTREITTPRSFSPMSFNDAGGDVVCAIYLPLSHIDDVASS